MSIEGQIDSDLKSAMLAGDKQTVQTLRVIKSALQNRAIETGQQSAGLGDDEVQKVLATELKKRLEAAEVYKQANEVERAQKELSEKTVIEAYLPKPLDEAALTALVDKHIKELSASTLADMGKVIGAVKQEAGAAADGATLARLVKEKLQ
ncbi:hypothetical protein A3F38_01080 [Candidatus Saccharibacteria bacterium RIFCSPHIGHO2_12_FULL_48_21]|nr:MAG: hypothetical protein A3F38_01080 [Candidatus Saccharibacteria bacterium RIFCSPHIGHO2_12_FULL_48_21]